MKFFKINDYNDHCVYLDDNFQDILKKLNASGLRICFVITMQKKLIGTITDGDIRKHILKKNIFNFQVKDIYNKTFHYHIIETKNQFKIKNFKKDSLIIPVTNKKKKLIGYKSFLANEYKTKNTTFVLAVGGFGKRLLPLTKSIPKPMIKIKNKPILEHIINNAKKFGFKNFIFLTHYKKKIIENYFKNGKKFGVNIQYSNEANPLGTAGGLYDIKSKLTNDFILCNGDIISKINFEDILQFHYKKKSQFTICAKVLEKQSKYGVLKTRKFNLIKIEEKPIDSLTINAGIYVINKKSLFNILNEKKKINIDEIIKALLKKKRDKIMVYPIDSLWYDLGTKNNLLKFK